MKPLDAVIAGLSKINDWIGAVGKYLSLTLIGLMTLVIIVQVFFRYVLNNALPWSEEVARYMMIWMVFLVAPIAYRRGLNVAIEIFPGLFSPRWRAALMVVINVLVIAALVRLLMESPGVLDRATRITAQTIPIEMVYIYVSMPIGLAAMVLAGVEIILRSVRDIVEPPVEDSQTAVPAASQVEL